MFFSARRPEDVDTIIDGLSRLRRIPHARRLEVARNGKVDQLGNDVDVVVYSEFDGPAELAAFKAHPIYAEAVSIVRPLRELRLAADYTVADGAGAPDAPAQ